MSRSLEQWSRELPVALRRLPSVAEVQLRDLGDRALRAVRERAKGGIKESLSLDAVAGEVRIGSNHPGAYALETGDTIHGSPWLAIPLAGVHAEAGPRSDPANLFVLRARDGRLFLASKSSGVVQLRWKLQAQVTPRRQPFMGPGIDAARADFPERVLAAGHREMVG